MFLKSERSKFQKMEDIFEFLINLWSNIFRNQNKNLFLYLSQILKKIDSVVP